MYCASRRLSALARRTGADGQAFDMLSQPPPSAALLTIVERARQVKVFIYDLAAAGLQWPLTNTSAT